MKSFLMTLASVIVLTLLHEFGHYITAKIMKQTVYGYGVRLFPYPSIYVSIKFPSENYKKNIYLFSGFFFTICSFLIFFKFDFFNLDFLFWAYFIQLLIETNPFYSDFTIAYITNKYKSYDGRSYIKFHNLYMRSKFWYLHFVSWLAVIILLLNYKFPIFLL